MMINSYPVNTSVQLTNAFTVKSTGAFVDPSDVICHVKDPAGVKTTYTFSTSGVSKDSVGHYHVVITPTVAGTWTYNWFGSGNPSVQTFDQQFVVHGTIVS